VTWQRPENQVQPQLDSGIGSSFLPEGLLHRRGHTWLYGDAAWITTNLKRGRLAASATDEETALTLLPFVPPRSYLRLLNLRNCYYAGSRFLDHVDNDRFDPWPWRFHLPFFFLRNFLR
jgi:hypothetical protein